MLSAIRKALQQQKNVVEMLYESGNKIEVRISNISEDRICTPYD